MVSKTNQTFQDEPSCLADLSQGLKFLKNQSVSKTNNELH